MSDFRKNIRPAIGWAAISEDKPPEIWHVAWYREHLPNYLKHIRVRVTPLIPKRPKKRGRRAS